MKNSQNAGRSLPIPTNRELTVSLIGSIIRFAIDVPQVLGRRENLAPDKLFFLLLPIVRNLGKLIDRIRHSSSVAGRNASDGSGRFEMSGGPELPHTTLTRPVVMHPNNGAAPVSTIPATAPTNTMLWQHCPPNPQRQRQQQQQLQQHDHHHCTSTSMLMSDEDDEESSSVTFEMHRDSILPGPCRQVLRQKDGNYAIRETTDTRGADGTFQRITKTISGPDVMILTNISSQLAELPTLMPKATVVVAGARTEK
ncbi:uncharacterized protein LOC120897419 [Anopheles arabiensis]|uniref:uncharacterized protein LOC120897419 n=1 Tax=Anopheles arabiensis TaxID=7173 RepID=UPI001AAC7F73|nr:uncharacterized protein LOC120897419 [Anopheles arabiensis]